MSGTVGGCLCSTAFGRALQDASCCDANVRGLSKTKQRRAVTSFELPDEAQKEK